jgi:GT2 family glycosyltransferase
MSRSVSDISVITVNWNGRTHLEELIPSLLPLGAKEIIVVDNGSNDDSVAFLESTYPEIRILKNDANQGFSQPNNLAAAGAQGDVLALINNDMRAHPEWLINGLRGLEAAPCTACRILDWDGKRIDYNGSSLQYLGYALQKDIGELVQDVTHEAKVLFPCGGAMLIDRRTFLDMGGFDESFFALYEDVDLGWRLWLAGHEVSFSPDSIVYHRGHTTFKTQTVAKMRYLMHRNALLTILKNYEEATLHRVFPAAILLAIKRAVRCSGVRRESFYLWEDVESKLKAEDQVAHFEVLDALNHLVAVEDVLKMLPDLMQKRRQIQEMRRRPDSEILELFKDPLRPIVEDPDYISEESELLEVLGLNDIFDVSAYREYASKLPDRKGARARELRDELRGLEWVGTNALLHPPQPKTQSKLRKFLDAWKHSGLRHAARLAWESYRRAT